jgi:Helix-turn-helix domain
MNPVCNQLLLPFSEKDYVDVRRAADILGLSTRAIFELYEAGQIEMIDYAKRKWKRVRYQSIVDFCDKLRQKYAIPDRRPPLSNPMFRHRDADILPFPLEDTINVEQTMQILGYISEPPVYNMITEGRFEAYHFLPNSPWRISRSSLANYLEGVHRAARQTNPHPSIPL